LKEKVLIIFGSLLLLFILGCTYYTFFVPKVGPIGDGKIAPTTYTVIICSSISAILAIIQGILGLKRQRNLKNKETKR